MTTGNLHSHFRYASRLRPFLQFDLNRLGACPTSYTWEYRKPFGTMAFHRRLTAFEESQLDLVFLREEERVCIS